MTRGFSLAATVMVGMGGAAAAQSTADPAVTMALELVRKDNAWTVEQQISLCEFPAPPFKEAARGAEFRRRMEALGYRATIDEVGNVISVRAGTGGGRRLVLAAHLDTVFPEGTDVRVSRDGGRLKGAGIGDDCRGLAVVLAVARAMSLAKVKTTGDVVFVANVGEEGPGNLRGARHLFEQKSAGRIDAFVSVDGIGLGMVTKAVGSNRYQVTYRGPGGHSYGDFGIPNPIHAMGRAIAAIADLQVPVTPRTIFNVGVVQGGTSVNSIAAKATMQIDLRSESAQALATLDTAMQQALRTALTAESARWPGASKSLELTVDVIGRRAAGGQPDTLWLARAAQGAAQSLGFSAPAGAAGSTDANVPIGLGIPAIAIDGGGRGEGAHSLGEWYEDGDRGYLGPQWALLIVWAATTAH